MNKINLFLFRTYKSSYKFGLSVSFVCVKKTVGSEFFLVTHTTCREGLNLKLLLGKNANYVKIIYFQRKFAKNLFCWRTMKKCPKGLNA